MFSADDLVVLLSFLREQAEMESESSCVEIETSLAVAMCDVCEALYLNPGQIRSVLGDVAYDAIHGEPIMVTLPEGDPWAGLRAQVRATYAKSRNVTVFGPGGRRRDRPGTEEALVAVAPALREARQT